MTFVAIGGLRDNYLISDVSVEACSNSSRAELTVHMMDTLTLNLMPLDEIASVCRYVVYVSRYI